MKLFIVIKSGYVTEYLPFTKKEVAQEVFDYLGADLLVEAECLDSFDKFLDSRLKSNICGNFPEDTKKLIVEMIDTIRLVEDMMLKHQLFIQFEKVMDQAETDMHNRI